jgi:hypothetical protein
MPPARRGARPFTSASRQNATNAKIQAKNSLAAQASGLRLSTLYPKIVKAFAERKQHLTLIQRDVLPRPAQVSDGLSGFRNFGRTFAIRALLEITAP